ncbi:glycosyltransferase [Sulfurovum sp.]|uniref:glycosyltransferase n=1 Tax=Sulfurovum sp. TaxID=1969726 RepID=UPI00356A7FFF
MKILVVVPSFFPATVYGGPIFSTLHTCQELAKLENINVNVSTTNANMTSKLDVKTDEWEKLDEHFFVKYYNETKINVLSLSLLFNVWKDIRNSDVVHAQYMFSTPTPIALFYAKVFSKPILLSPRGALCKWCLEQGSRFKKLWLGLLIRPFVKSLYWHATAQQEKDEILAQFPNAQVEIIPNGIEFDVFQTYNRVTSKEFCKTYAQQATDIDGEKIIVSMGRLQKKKGFDILIDAFAKIMPDYPTAKLFIAGQDEKEGGNLTRQIAGLGLEQQVFLVGEIQGQDKIDFLANADLFVLPSHNENFGNVYVESLAAGTPIVASTGTPWSEVEDTNCGKWVNNSVEETAQAMLEMLGKDREQMRENAKRLAKKYDWKNIAIEFKKLFEKMTHE